ncbi:MAG: hypothetical protein M3024_02115, partial [Candidatus Dormibacteraeota bacterium]|nr:hypothetical protein [Candidatus Dormibacteraeota bacterium]
CWVIEAQAEPWGDDSLDVEGMVAVFEGVRQAGFDTILLWGAEHWLQREAAGDASWLEAATAMAGRE